MKKLYFLFLLVTLLSCEADNKATSFKHNTIFTTAETDALLSVLGLFDQAVAKIEQVNTEDIATSYASFFERLKKESNSKVFSIGISERDQLYIESKLSQELAKEIWSAMYRRHENEDEKIDTTYYLNPSGKFFSYLETELAPSESSIKELVDRVRQFGDMTPSFFANILMNYHKYNVEDDRIRLMIALHYIGINRGQINRRKQLKGD